MAKQDPVGRHILVVDDEALVCDSIRRLLAADGHAVETATSGQAALALFQNTRFDLSIVDYEMPGMNGDQLAVALKAIDPKQPVAMVTAYPETLAASGNPLVGVDLLISKPFDLQGFRQAVAKLLLKSMKSPTPAETPPVPPKVKVTFAVADLDAKQVWLGGEFNGWSPNATPMERHEDGHWETTVALAPGQYQYKFIVDGEWLPDPAAQRNVPNEYGSLNSVVEVRA